MSGVLSCSLEVTTIIKALINASHKAQGHPSLGYSCSTSRVQPGSIYEEAIEGNTEGIPH